ncbi:MAG: PaaI family thioesterase [bacterium]
MSGPHGLDPTAAAGGFLDAIGGTVDGMTGDGGTMTVPVGPHLFQPYGIVHGGVFCTIVETLASLAAAAWFGERGDVVGVANHTNFLRAVRTGTLHAVASPIHRGRSQQLWLVEISDDEGRPVARGEVRLANLTSATGLG